MVLARLSALVIMVMVVLPSCSRTGLLLDDTIAQNNDNAVTSTANCSTCRDMNANCGSIDDGCGHRLQCGDCPAPSSCAGGGIANQCGCQPKACADFGAQCGDIVDGCGGVLNCGNCPGGEICGGAGPNRCGSQYCQPANCSQLGIRCGKVSDGCSQVIDCGGCAARQSCGGGGLANQCGCTRSTCAAKSAICGQTDDGCGGVLDCGSCPVPFSCGTTSPNQCGCIRLTCAAMGATCGTMLDGCGGELNCGTCGNGGGGRRGGSRAEACVGVGPSVCGEEGLACTPATCARFGAECGQVANGCGGVLDCGTCTSLMTCGGGGVPNHCGCLPATCDSLGANCGNVDDGCGAILACGDCPIGLACNSSNHRCATAG